MVNMGHLRLGLRPCQVRPLRALAPVRAGQRPVRGQGPARPGPRRAGSPPNGATRHPSRRRAGHRPGRPRRLVHAGQGGRIDCPIGGPRPRHPSRPPPRRHRAGAAWHRGRRHRELVVRRRQAGRRMDRQLPARADRLGRPGVAGRAHRDRGRADADRARSRRPAAADPRRGDDRAARARPVAPVGRVAGHPGRAPARRRFHRLRHRRPAVGGADPVDRRAAVVHRCAVRRAADHRHDDPRGARHGAGDVRHPAVARRPGVLRRRRLAEYADADPEDFSDGYYDGPSAYNDDEAQAWPDRHADGELPARR